MESPLFFLLLTTIAFTDHVHCQGIHASMNPLPVGSNVTLSSNATITWGEWLFNNQVLVLISPGGYRLRQAKSDRLKFNISTSSLDISLARLEDSGVYKLEEFDQFAVSLELSVQVPVSNVTVSAKKVDLVEFNDTAVLMCSVSNGTSLTYQWLAGNSTISSREGLEFRNESATLYIFGVSRNDQGPYSCNVSNGLGYEVSPPFSLNISYGPGNTTMTVMPDQPLHRSGSNIILSCSTDSNPTATVQWMFNETYLDHWGSQLDLQNVQVKHTGTYKCVSYNSATMLSSSKSKDIRVMEPISNVTVSAKKVDLVEFNDTAVLMCSASTGTSLTYQWLAGNSTISSSKGVEFRNESATLCIFGVSRNDQGPYRCNVSNELGYEVSPPFSLNISYGPSNTIMTVMPDWHVYRSGSNITLSCSTDSNPTATVQWMFNETYLDHWGSQLDLHNVEENHTGTYKCVFHNAATMQFSSKSKDIRVIDPIRWVRVEAEMNPAVEGHSYDLTCSVEGTAAHIYWMRNGEKLHSDNRTLILNNNMTIRFRSIHRNDTEEYQCMAINIFGNMTSMTFRPLVKYGPMMPNIMGPNMGILGSNVTLSCMAESVPPSLYRWYFNGNLISNMSEYMTPPLTKDMSGNYICVAYNNITGKNSTASMTLTAMDVQIDTPTSLALEDSSYELTCSVSGTFDHIYWMKNWEKLHPDNGTFFSMDNKTVTFMPVDRYDTGKYKCMAINAIGSVTSAAYMLHVNFGPDKPVISGPEFGEMGRDAVFHCSAASMPASNYTWWFAGSLVANTSEFIAGPLSFNMSGEYTCMAHNHVTGMNSTNSTTLTVIEAIESVMIQGNTTPVLNENFTLLCHVVGPYDTIYWMKDNTQLNMNSYMYNIEENMLHFAPLTRESAGTYWCVATNRAAHHNSPQYQLLVNYGPLNVSISGPGTGQEGESVTLQCTADSRPECDFEWLLDNETIPLWSGSVLNFNATKEKEGTYVCIATNPVTRVTMMQNKTFSIENHASAGYIPNKGALLLMGLCCFFTHLLFL